jgi:hypothetical protein
VTFPAAAMVASSMRAMNDAGVARQSLYNFLPENPDGPVSGTIRYLDPRQPAVRPFEWSVMPIGTDTATLNRALMDLHALTTEATLQACDLGDATVTTCTFRTARDRYFKQGNTSYWFTPGTYQITADLDTGNVVALPVGSTLRTTATTTGQTRAALVGQSFVAINPDIPDTVKVVPGYNDEPDPPTDAPGLDIAADHDPDRRPTDPPPAG